VPETASEILDCLARLSEDRARRDRRLGELLGEMDGEAGQAAIEALAEALCDRLLSSESRKALLHLLVERGCLLPALRSIYDTDRVRFRELLSLAHALEPRLHTFVSKRLRDLLASDCSNRAGEALWSFDSLAGMNGLANLAGELPLLQGAKDPRLRARAALLSSSLPGGRHLLEQYREQADPRVRACILEWLWFADQPIARVAFEEARRDVQPRVKAYGLLGLYRLGDLRALPALAEMAESSQSLTRAVARGAMEMLQEPRFNLHLERLRKEFGDSPAKGESLSLAVTPGPRQLQLPVPLVQKLARGGLRLQVSVRLDDDEPLDPPLRSLDLRAWTDGQPVFNYAARRLAPAGRLAFGVVLPLTLRAASETTPGIRGVLDALMSMPEGELRSAGFYRSGLFMRRLENDHDGASNLPLAEAPQPLRGPVITQDAPRFAADLKDAAREDNLALEPGELALAMVHRLKTLKPVGHVGVVLNEAVKGPPSPCLAESLIQACRANDFALHLVIVGQVRDEILTPWQALNQDSGGFHARIADEEELPGVVHNWMLCFRESYELEFDAPASTSAIRLQAVHAAGAGEITVQVENG
jgi:hypothetical protein